nr:MAG: hypothetical protein [uncultured bacterium]
MGKLKKLLFLLCGIFAFSLISCHDSFALDAWSPVVDFSASTTVGKFELDPTFSFPALSYYTFRVSGAQGSDGISVIYPKFSFIDSIDVPEKTYATVSYYAYIPTSDFDSYAELYPSCPSSFNDIKVINCTVTSMANDPIDSVPNPPGGSFYETAMRYRVEFSLYFEKGLPAGQHDFTISGFIFHGLVYSGKSLSVALAFDSINFSSTSPDFSASATDKQTEQQKEQFDKEQEQREEDKQAAEDAGNNSQSSSDDSQKQADDASKNLFQVLTEFVSAISGASASSCSITGDFGFFNVGSIDLCTGASKVQPITTVIGTVMLIGLCIPAVVTLLHRFVSLYNEVMS